MLLGWYVRDGEVYRTKVLPCSNSIPLRRSPKCLNVEVAIIVHDV